jgi:hypothetical protein
MSEIVDELNLASLMELEKSIRCRTYNEVVIKIMRRKMARSETEHTSDSIPTVRYDLSTAERGRSC